MSSHTASMRSSTEASLQSEGSGVESPGRTTRVVMFLLRVDPMYPIILSLRRVRHSVQKKRRHLVPPPPPVDGAEFLKARRREPDLHGLTQRLAAGEDVDGLSLLLVLVGWREPVMSKNCASSEGWSVQRESSPAAAEARSRVA